MYYKHHKKFKRKFKPPILRVPVEIRLRIYEYAFRDARIIDVTTTQRGTVQRSKGIQSLLVVNKRIRQEATKTFYRRCLFRINHFELHPKQKRLNPMTTLNSIARLEVLWSPSPRSRFTSTNNDAQFLLGLESLKEITFNLLNMQYLSIPRQDSKIELHEAMLAKWTVTFSNLPSWVERVLDARRSNLKIFLIPYFLVGPNRDADLTVRTSENHTPIRPNHS